jgi:small subunit ribosomal protein S2
MPNIPSLPDMLKAGVHFGHRTSRWHPKMAQYIFGARSGVHVIDIEQTQSQLETVLSYVEDLVARGGVVLFIGTKSQTQESVAKYAKEANSPYVNTRWLGGTFTNFPEIQKLLKQYLDLKDKREKGELKKYTKLEQLNFDRKIEDLDVKIGGMAEYIKKLPEAIFVVDVRHDKTAVMEARSKGVKVIGIVDTNVNPDLVDHIIPANDDSIGSVTMMLKLMAEAINVGRARAKNTAATAAKNAAEAEAVKASASSKAQVDDLDDQMKDQLVKEKEENKK